MIINKKLLKDIIYTVAGKHKFRPIIIEKDYYITLILNNIGELLNKNLVFKGGTLLNKIHLNYHRLSEDIDFTYYSEEDLSTRSQRSKAITPIRENMSNFLKQLNLKSDNPKGEGFNNSTQYIFDVKYPSLIAGKYGNVKIEIGLRQLPIEKPVYNKIKHFYKDPFTEENLIPENKILSLTYNEAVAEKLKASITRKEPAIRDFYDLWHIQKTKFDFQNDKFVNIFKKKIADEGYKEDFTNNFGLNKNKIDLLYKQVETDLLPVIRAGEEFYLEKVFDNFNVILPYLK